MRETGMKGGGQSMAATLWLPTHTNMHTHTDTLTHNDTNMHTHTDTLTHNDTNIFTPSFAHVHSLSLPPRTPLPPPPAALSLPLTHTHTRHTTHDTRHTTQSLSHLCLRAEGNAGLSCAQV